MANPAIQEFDGGVVFTAKIVPGSSGQTRFCGLLDGMVKVKVSAAPEKGKANKCLLKFLAKQLDVKKNAVSIISGQTSPIKHVQVLDISVDTLMEKLGLNKQDFC
ncbi:MAG: DUF167 domain-containing protein [Planctomycetota bacterium]|jgi:uncharacterized protein (TIGR00251 family)